MYRRVPIPVLFVALATAPLSSCENLPGSRTQQSTVLGGAAGAAAGAAIAGEGNRLVGALIGGAVGAGAGYLIGAKTSWFEDEDGDRHARTAIENARKDPATVADVARASTADLNSDGFVTFDELVAMDQAGLPDAEFLARLRATDQIFELNEDQRRALLDAGISPAVVAEMPRINHAEKNRVLSERRDSAAPSR